MTTLTRSLETEELDLFYEESGPADGSPVLLLHGWPDDVRTWDAVVEQLVEAGHRCIVPHLRGFGLTRIRARATPRNAQPTALASDAHDLMEALDLKDVIVVGHDWGAHTGYVLAALWPERIQRLLTLSVAYQIEPPEGGEVHPEQAHAYFYQWFFATQRGREALLDNHLELCQHLWDTWSPDWENKPTDFRHTSASWANEDWVDITLHMYRFRWRFEPADARWNDLEQRLRQSPQVHVPSLHLHGKNDGATLADHLPDDAHLFAAPHRRQILPDTGHFIPRERPDIVVAAIRAPHFP